VATSGTRTPRRKGLAGSLVAVAGIVSSAARSDYLAYFNPLAGKTKQVLITGCDLDCGQDLYRLAEALRANTFRTCTLPCGAAPNFIHGIAEMEVLAPFHPVTGWWQSAHARCALAMFPHHRSAACLRLD